MCSKHYVTVCLCLLFVNVGYVTSQADQQLLNKLLCIEHEECGACLAAAEHCRWCADAGFGVQAQRCNDEHTLKAAGCSWGAIQHPEPSWTKIMEYRPLQDIRPGNITDVVQIYPQRVQISMKPRESKQIKFKYRPAKNYPLDLYYLMDLTWSMKDDKETLVSLGDDLALMLKNLTDNFRLGFGSFADKPLMPFISVDDHRRANPCTMMDHEEACEATYNYRHHLSLTDKVPEFIQKVNTSAVTANLDNAEAQLDALVQVVTCGSKVGWMPVSRKIVLLLSDGLMHTAGDGLLGGAAQKNDETCHLDDNGYYTESAKYDYPSVAQVYRLLETNKVNIIFAVTESVKDHYDMLHQLLEDFTYVAKLESDSSNILKLVKTGYEDIISVVNFEDDSYLGPVKIKYFTDCGVMGGRMIEAHRCTGVEFGMTLNFEAHVTLASCPEHEQSKQVIKISESMLGQDSLTLEVELQCGCTCPAQTAADNACGENKHFVCGVCLCDQGWSGPNCDCSIKDDAASAALHSQCRQPNATRALACSGAGDCICGQCDCDRGYNGRYCQCKACELSGGLECGGIGRGVCVCGECACAAGWSGAACDCPLAQDACRAPGDDRLCSGNGDCVCGHCECLSDPEGGRYTGAFCESCPSCTNRLCTTAEPCVACHLAGNCTDLCTIGGANYTVAERLDDPVTDKNLASCIYRQEEDELPCEYAYTYDTKIRAMVAMEIVIRSKQCYTTSTASLVNTGLIIVVCIVAGGIIIIMAVKTSQIVADRKAYAKFLAEAEAARLNMQEVNPLYKPPISMYKPPDAFPREQMDQL